MKKRSPQLALRLDAEAPDTAARWRDGQGLPYLGGMVTLRLDTRGKEAVLEGGELHLPLPPEATPRQVQDAAESWLRARALRVVSAQAVMAARELGRPVPAMALSFATRAGWLQADGKGGLRCHWRLVEQSQDVIAQVVAQAVASLPRAEASLDLFALA
ncbi:MAG TPA: YgjP-like metallopeptidase domain-containing protein [Rhodocyclaceae bacterium]|nr:YgjP-like metallopeptidase domain-containing protein [Rhodocyclaceae bacterium]